MKNNSIREELSIILKKNFNIKTKISAETILSDLKEWDSLKQLDFIMIIEKKFKIKFQLTEMFKLKKIKEFIAIIKR